SRGRVLPAVLLCPRLQLAAGGQGGRAPGPGGPGGGGDLVRRSPRPVEIRFPGRVRLPGADGRRLLPDVAAPVLAAGVPRTAHPAGEPNRRIRAGSVWIDRKSTRLNSSHVSISYAVFSLKNTKHTR